MKAEGNTLRFGDLEVTAEQWSDITWLRNKITELSTPRPAESESVRLIREHALSAGSQGEMGPRPEVRVVSDTPAGDRSLTSVLIGKRHIWRFDNGDQARGAAGVKPTKRGMRGQFTRVPSSDVREA